MSLRKMNDKEEDNVGAISREQREKKRLPKQ